MPAGDSESNIIFFEKDQQVSVQRKSPAPKKRWRWLFFEIIFLVAALGGIFLILSLMSNFALNLVLLQEPLDIEDALTASLNQQIVDFNNKIIPAVLFEEEQTEKETFSAEGQGVEEKKAQAVIRVFNNYNPPKAIMLVEKTRFLSQDGKTFRALEKINLPAAVWQGGKLTASFQDVKVEAQEPGEEYNIGPSKFSVPGLAGGVLYYNVWAESTRAMEGGFKKEIAKISEDDIARGKNSVEQKLKRAVLENLKKSLPSELTLLEKTLSEELPEIACSSQVGTKTESFNCEGKIKFKALAVKTSDLKDYSHRLLAEKAPLAKNIRLETLQWSIAPVQSKSQEDVVVFNLKVRVNLYQKVAEGALLQQIAGKSAEEIKRIIARDHPEVSRTEFKFWPFWVRKAPANIDRIVVGYVFED